MHYHTESDSMKVDIFAQSESLCIQNLLSRKSLGLWLSVFLLIANAQWVGASSNSFSENFDRDGYTEREGGWRPDATPPSGALAQWKIVSDPNAPSPTKTLTIHRIHDRSRSVFNLYWTKKLSFRNGELEVRVRANSGKIDQGGGLIWRARDANNYYVARYNPLEHNFRLYYVKGGRRHLIATREGLTVGMNEWFHLRVHHEGHRIQGWFNNKDAWNVNDENLPDAGGIGLWTKADAASSFDDLRAVFLN